MSNYFLNAQGPEKELRINTGFLALSTVKPHAGMAAMRWANHPRDFDRHDAEKKRPVRGDNRTGQSHMGAWGGWALAPNTADGEGLPLPHI